MKSKYLNLRVTDEQHASWSAKASQAGLSLSAWLRSLADGILSSPEQCTSEPSQPTIATPTVSLVEPAPRKSAITPPMYASPAKPLERKPCLKCQRVLFNGATCQYCLTSPVA